MSRLLLYNPENDIALASGLERFTPPAIGRAMAEAGALLPFWWAEPGDQVIVPPHLRRSAMELKERHGLDGSVGYRRAAVAEPWGWSAYTRRLFLSAGMPPERLPSPEAIDSIRRLSHRRTTVDVHRALSTPDHLLPVEATTVDEAVEACRRFGRAVVKQPWSCSGRGVFFTSQISADDLRGRIAGAIRRQGSLLVEPEYERVAELAALFYADGGKVVYRGMSIFTADLRGAYTGNLVASPEELERRAGSDAVAAAMRLQTVLTDVIGRGYRGWLGVDMLRHAAGLNPCMEINLRMTMGVVALILGCRLPQGRLSVIRGPLPAGAIDLSPTDSPIRFCYQMEERRL